jgi:hypothetical protein
VWAETCRDCNENKNKISFTIVANDGFISNSFDIKKNHIKSRILRRSVYKFSAQFLHLQTLDMFGISVRLVSGLCNDFPPPPQKKIPTFSFRRQVKKGKQHSEKFSEPKIKKK